jgi:hypothetical protein
MSVMTKDPLPGNPVVDYTWSSIKTGHKLMVLDGTHVMDWEPASGHVRIWNYDPRVSGTADPFPGAPVVEYTWTSIKTGHELLVLPSNRIMDWEPATGHVRIWNYSPSTTGKADPLPGNPLVDYTWTGIRAGHRLFMLEGSRIMDWEPATGNVRIWTYDPRVTGNADPLPGAPVAEYTWTTIKTGHELLVLPLNRIMDWEPATGHVRIWTYQPSVTGKSDPLPGAPVAEWIWDSIRSPHQLTALTGPNRVLDLEPNTGRVRIWNYVP